ncbi:putative endothelin-converting enzyme 2 [Scophthalmus maximus]|uniref:EEF1A lysine methyltransferase 4 n=1 Tax=Scophthalmus maximus TaxID=52904 RepID=A0A2U9BJC1_SCOMX|nr:EEF1A lysine methyltransferase 4 [Scophthalmus maximus]AWP04158.1 putative endothelin-converting enzyme 2 [Scophthalmus maximus]
MDYVPDDNSRYKDVDYWDERYTTEQSYDWLGCFSKFRHILENHVKKEDSILILGCGNSSMSGDMYTAGYRSITNIDYSSVCISAMAARHSDCPDMTWRQMDVRQLCFPSMSFDVILEKATLDAISVEEKSPWDVSPQTACFFHQALSEISRCLKPGGRFVSVTFAQPHFRKRLYARTEYNWSIKQHSYGTGFLYYVYVMTKGEKLSPEDADLEKKLLEKKLLEDTKAPANRDTTTQHEDKEDFLSNIDL